LVYTLVESNRSEPGSNKKLFGIGEFLEFDTEDVTLPDLLGVPRQVDLQHNTTLLDYADAGLTTDEINEITSSATAKKKELEGTVAELQVKVGNQQTAAIENQKRINETRKLISAVSQIISSDDTILKKLQSREQDLLVERDAIITLINTTNAELKTAYDQLVKISELVH
jgi:Mg2+ and Co2+ transporter CorA